MKAAIAAMLALALQAFESAAADGAPPEFSLSGFGTLGAVHSSEDKADFTSTLAKPAGAGYSHRWSGAVDSLVAVQADAILTREWSAVLQIVSEQDSGNSWRPHVEWANIKYRVTPDISVRAGRIVVPAFLLSETRKVGYTFAWVRPPLEVYRLLPVAHSDGVDGEMRMRFGEWLGTARANAGRSDLTLANNVGKAEVRGSWGLSYSAERGPLSALATYKRTRLSIAAPDALLDAFRRFGPSGEEIADKYEFGEKPFTVYAVGASYEPRDWFVMGEWAHRDSETLAGKRIAWYASGGYRIGKFTPYVTYARSKAGNLSDPGLDVTRLPPQLAGPARQLNAGLNAFLQTRTVQETLSLGARWDFARRAALKLQFDRTDIGAGSNGTLSNIQPGFQPGGRLDVISASVDFVF